MEPKGQNVGYVRVSSLDQNMDRQLVGVELDEVFRDAVSGKDTNRPGLQSCLRHLRKGDALHVHSMDRLARNLVDLLKLVRELTERGVSVSFHKEGLTFTGEENPMQQLQLSIMGAVAEFERAMIRERQREGIAAAKRKGKKLGRPSALNPDKLVELKARVAAGEEKKALAQELGISRATLYQHLK